MGCQAPPYSLRVSDLLSHGFSRTLSDIDTDMIESWLVTAETCRNLYISGCVWPVEALVSGNTLSY